MPRLLLDKQHRALGAVMQAHGGWELPRHYGDAVAEHQAVRQHAGAADLSARGLWRVSGADRAKYLQGLLTNDILALTPGSGCYTALLDVKGHLQADMFAYAFEEHLLLDLAPTLTETVVPLLKRYIVVYKVKLEDAAAEQLHLMIAGPAATAWLQRLFSESLPTLPDQHHVTRPWQGQPVHLIRRSETGEDGIHLLVPHTIGSEFWNTLLEQGRECGGRPVGADALESLRVEAGIPTFGAELDASHFPAEAALDQAVSYTKGCYLGQETTMRIHTQGSVNRKLVGLLIDSPSLPNPGTPLLMDGLEVGRLTSVVVSPTLQKTIALGYLRKGCWEVGNNVVIKSGGSATVTPRPFYQSAAASIDPG